MSSYNRDICEWGCVLKVGPIESTTYTYIATSVAITDPRLGNSPQYTVTSSGKNLFATVKGSNPVADIGEWCYYVFPVFNIRQEIPGDL